MARAMWRIDGSTVYVLNKNGENLLSFHVQPGKVSNGERVPETFCQSVAENIMETLNRKDGHCVLELL